MASAGAPFVTKARHAGAGAVIPLAVMHTSNLAAFLLPLSLLSLAPAQVQIPVNPRATYLRINNDASALPAPAVPVSALGVSVGQWVRITTTGGFSASGSPDTERNLIAVFSSTPTLLANATGQVSRVPNAILAGPSYVSGNTSSGALSTDIPQDFIVGRTGWSNGTLVQVPAGATHVFLSTFRSTTTNSFSGNSDPNNDYFAVFTPVSTATLQGTAEHVELRTAINGTPSATPDVKQASPFTTLSVDVVQRFGVSTGQVWLLAANIFPTGGSAPVGPLPDFHMGSGFVIVQVGVTTTAAGQWSFFVPPGNAGTTLVLQGCFLSNAARNGLLQGSDAHRIELQ
jgi:hypothetical protein